MPTQALISGLSTAYIEELTYSDQRCVVVSHWKLWQMHSESANEGHFKIGCSQVRWVLATYNLFSERVNHRIKLITTINCLWFSVYNQNPCNWNHLEFPHVLNTVLCCNSITSVGWQSAHLSSSKEELGDRIGLSKVLRKRCMPFETRSVCWKNCWSWLGH